MSTGQPYILLIGLGVDDLPIDPQLRAQMAEVARSCPDVFRGLARLGHDKRVVGVIVDVAGLSSRHMEFFSLVGRVRRGLHVYVLASVETVADRVDRAVALGATGTLTGQTVRRLLASCRPQGGATAATRGGVPESDTIAEVPVKPRTPPRPPADLQPTVSPFAEEIAGDSAVPAEADAGAACESADETDEGGIAEQPVRVPWLRYADAPDRRGPRSRREPPPRKPPSAGRSKAGNPPGESGEHEPLLTDEELTALLGDPTQEAHGGRIGDDAGREPAG